jgi:excisionase family DNA binding protein
MSDVMLALYLNVSERVIRQWRSAAKIPGTVEMPGRVTRTRRADIDEWLAALPTEGK